MAQESHCKSSCWNSLVQRQVNIVEEQGTERNTKLGWTEWIIYLLFVIGCVVVTFEASKEKFYDYDYVKGVVTTQVSGYVYARAADSSGEDRLWDVTDIVIPPRGPDEFVVMTHVLPLLTQTQGVCDEHPTVKGIICESHDDCQQMNGTSLEGSHGPTTGLCIPSTYPRYAGIYVCQISAWCPVQLNDQEMSNAALLQDTRSWTVLIKNDIEFPNFGNTWGNHKYFGPSIDVNDLNTSNCIYDGSDPHGKFCPIFKLQTIVEGAKQSYESIARTGGVIRIIISWNCNMATLDDCDPKYTFKRMDRIQPGYDVSHRTDRQDKNRNERVLFKANGIRFIVSVEGKGKKCTFLNVVRTFGGYLALITSKCTEKCRTCWTWLLKSCCGRCRRDNNREAPQSNTAGHRQTNTGEPSSCQTNDEEIAL